MVKPALLRPIRYVTILFIAQTHHISFTDSILFWASPRYHGVSINGGTQKQLVYKEKSHLEMDDDWGTPILGNPHINPHMNHGAVAGSCIAIDSALGPSRNRRPEMGRTKGHTDSPSA